MYHVSIDLETFASSADASICAIGVAVGEERTQGGYWIRQVANTLVFVDDPAGRIVTRTVRWHAMQEDMLGNVGSEREAIPLHEALVALSRFLGAARTKVEGASRIWTHATFDMPVLQSAYDRAGVEIPWHYRNCRDLRTIYDLAGGRPKVEHAGKHNALNDAEAQLREVEACMRIIRGE